MERIGQGPIGWERKGLVPFQRTLTLFRVHLSVLESIWLSACTFLPNLIIECIAIPQ